MPEKLIDLFPYENFPIRLEYGEKKDFVICYFECNEHLQKHLTRYKLDKKKIKIFYRDGEPIQQRKTNKRSVESKSKTKNN